MTGAIEIWDETWHVPARTVDMLGRQQIANIPTALHELFKNAHDAYAEHVIADYYRVDRILLIRDDGDGMTPEQLRRGWLTLASSEKRNANDGAGSHPGDGRPRRPIMGEKGIGRLAIASIGPQVLIMTRPRTSERSPAPLLVSLVHWRVNQLSDVDLSRVVVPTVRIVGGGLPDASTVRTLADRLASNVAGLRTSANGREVDVILDELAAISLDPAADLASLDGPCLAGGRHGTQFLVLPTDEMLASDLHRASDDEPTQVEKYLLGFSNTMMPNRPPPAIKAIINDHREDGTVDTPIGEQVFFTPEEFSSADHAIEGTFDAFGHFSGWIRIYGGAPREHAIAWKNATGRPTRCGPFRINFAYLQGQLKDTRLPPDHWSEMTAKLNRMGGLYVYRDGIRILPYGGPDQDFVGIERRRTKSASDWFFSYRRIFGAVEITHAENCNLREKAGREGFIRDAAYNDFVGILTTFFEGVAIDFFRDGSRHGEWAETKERLNREAALLAKRRKSSKQKLDRFGRDLDAFFARLENNDVADAAARIRSGAEARVRVLANVVDPAAGVRAVLDLEAHLRREVDDLEAGLLVAKPRGVGLTKARSADWEAYGRNHARVVGEIIVPLRAELRALVDRLVEDRGLPVDRRRRIDAALKDRGGRAVMETSRLRRDVDKRLEELREGIGRTLKQSVADLAAQVERTRIEFLSTDTNAASQSDLERLQFRWEGAIEHSARETSLLLANLAEQLRTLVDAVDRGETLDETTDALEARGEAYRDQLDQYVELAQLGTAVGIVQHEFAGAVGTVRRAIRQLGAWADSNPALGQVDRDLRNGFEHLDAYLNLFAPLSRRLTRTRIDVSGREVRTYLAEVFDARLERHGVRVEASAAFDGATVMGQPSAVLAAFVNLMDNAIHWMGEIPRDAKLITLDANESGVTMTNSGPGIPARIADRIFDYGETTRTGGRGLGLYVSREALRRSGLDLTLENAGQARHPTFRIAPVTGQEPKGEPE